MLGHASPDALDIPLWNTIILELSHKALHDVIQAWTEAAARHNGDICLGWVEVDILTGTCPDGPSWQWDTHLHAEHSHSPYLPQ